MSEEADIYILEVAVVGEIKGRDTYIPLFLLSNIISLDT